MSQKFAHVDSEGHVIDFYADDVHESHQIPSGAIPITESQYQEMIHGRTYRMRAKVTPDGKHSLVPPLPPTKEEQLHLITRNRRAALIESDWIAARHSDEKLAEEETTLSADQAKLLMQYRKTLRNLTDQPGYPFVELPTKPDFIKGFK